MSAVRSLAGICVVVPAAGIGSRLSSQTPKQYLTLQGKTVLEVTLARLLALHPDRLVLVVAASDERYQQIPLVEACEVVTGGELRSDSVMSGLTALDIAAPDFVMVHDAVRPCVRTADILHLKDEVEDEPAGGLLAVPVIDTLKLTTADTVTTPDRRDLWHAQTPQMFRYGVLRDAIRNGDHATMTDESSAVEMAGYQPKLVPGHRDNIKITEPGDVELAQFYLESGACE